MTPNDIAMIVRSHYLREPAAITIHSVEACSIHDVVASNSAHASFTKWIEEAWRVRFSLRYPSDFALPDPATVYVCLPKQVLHFLYPEPEETYYDSDEQDDEE